MASRYFVSAAVLALVAGGAGFWLAKSDLTVPAQAETPAAVAAPVAARTPTAENPKVADVAGEAILKSDVDALYANIKTRMGDKGPSEDQIFWMLVDQIVASRLVIQAANADKLMDTPEVQTSLKMATEQILQEAYIRKALIGSDSDEALKPAYDKLVEGMKGQEEVKASHILVADEAKARDLIAQLAKGAKFEELAKANSTDPGSKDNGGDLGYFTKETMVPEFATAAFAGTKGQVVATPVKTQFGWHVIKVEDRRARQAPAFADVKPQLAQEAQQAKVQQIIESLRAKANVQRFTGAGIPALPAETTTPATAK